MRRVSDLLKEKREEKKLTLQKIEEETKIKKEFLELIEEGNFQALPSESYALGFVKNYAKYLELPLSSVVPLFRREYKSKQIPIVPEFRKSQNKFNRRFFASPKGVLIIAVFLIVSAYVFFQYSSLIFPPRLEVLTPSNGQIIIGNVVEVKGKTDPYATLYIDGDEVYVNLEGSFRKSVYVFSGDKKLKIVAKNRFGKENKKEINIRVE